MPRGVYRRSEKLNQQNTKRLLEGRKLKHDFSNKTKNKTYEEIYRIERAEEIKLKKSKSTKGRKNYWLVGDKSPMKKPEVVAKVLASDGWKKGHFQKGSIPWDKGITRPDMVGDKNPSKRPEVIKKIKSKLGPGSKHYEVVTSIAHREKVGRTTTARFLAGNFNYKGYFFSQKNNAMMGYRSNDEKLCMQIFEQMDRLSRYEYEKDSAPYVDVNGVKRHTIIDFHLYWGDGSEEMIEYKPMFKIKNNLYNTTMKLDAAKKYCEQKGIKFSVWSGDKIGLDEHGDEMPEFIPEKDYKPQERL